MTQWAAESIEDSGDQRDRASEQESKRSRASLDRAPLSGRVSENDTLFVVRAKEEDSGNQRDRASEQETGEEMAKGGRKRRARRKKGANHGKRPNA